MLAKCPRQFAVTHQAPRRSGHGAGSGPGGASCRPAALLAQRHRRHLSQCRISGRWRRTAGNKLCGGCPAVAPLPAAASCPAPACPYQLAKSLLHCVIPVLQHPDGPPEAPHVAARAHRPAAAVARRCGGAGQPQGECEGQACCMTPAELALQQHAGIGCGSLSARGKALSHNLRPASKCAAAAHQRGHRGALPGLL